MKHLILITALLFHNCIQAQKLPLILDADTGNEVDDLYALVRAFATDQFNIIGINATHWQTAHWAVENSMENSHRLNDMLLSYMDLQIPNYRGARERLFDWGNQSQTSAASEFIFHEASKQNAGNKLTIVVLGALTNVASAILDHPEIEDKIKLYWLGTSYDFEKEILKTTDFNCVMDIQAVDVLFNSEVEMYVIPVNVASAMTFDFHMTEKTLEDIHPVLDFLVARWVNHLDGGRYKRTIWDLALIEALIHPEFATTEVITTPNHLGKRKITYYKDIQDEKMRNDFFETMKNLSK